MMFRESQAPTSSRIFSVLGAVFAFLGIAAGAFGAHLVKALLTPDMLAVYETAARYQMYHAFGLLIVGWTSPQPGSPAVRLAGWMFVAGVVLFSGSLYAMSLSGIRWLGDVTPVGGLVFLAGWGLLAWAAYKQR